MGPVSAKLQATRDLQMPIEEVLEMFVTSELEDLKLKYNKLTIE